MKLEWENPKLEWRLVQEKLESSLERFLTQKVVVLLCHWGKFVDCGKSLEQEPKAKKVCWIGLWTRKRKKLYNGWSWSKLFR